jgi:hypothetical protein
MLVRRSFAYEPDRLANASRPGLAVSGKHDVRFDGLNALERFDRARKIAPERRELWPGPPGKHVQCCERVA